MNTNDDNREKDAAKGEPVPLQPIIDMGSTVVKNSRGTVYCLTIVGQAPPPRQTSRRLPSVNVTSVR